MKYRVYRSRFHTGPEDSVSSSKGREVRGSRVMFLREPSDACCLALTWSASSPVEMYHGSTISINSVNMALRERERERENVGNEASHSQAVVLNVGRIHDNLQHWPATYTHPSHTPSLTPHTVTHARVSSSTTSLISTCITNRIGASSSCMPCRYPRLGRSFT